MISFGYIAFLAIITLLFYILPQKYQRPLLFVASLGFIGSISIPFLLRYPRKVAGGRVTDALLAPIDIMPTWLQIGTYINPLFYGVDALRYCFNGSEIAALPLWLDLTVLLAFAAFTTTVSTILFRRTE